MVQSSAGTCAASARQIWPREISSCGPVDTLAMTMPSKPIGNSRMSRTPLVWHSAYSLGNIRRDAPVISGRSMPTPEQKSCMPPPVPVDSTTGVGKSVRAPKLSATAVENGKTVDEPTMRTTLREPDPAPPLEAAGAAVPEVPVPASEQAASARRPEPARLVRRSFFMV